MKNREYTRFCGIDVAKRKHVACVIDRRDESLVRSQSFNNDAHGYQTLLNRLKEAGRRSQILIGMEATDHYWYALRDYWLRRRGQGLHHLAAVTATAIKLCHVVWRILTDRRDYLPKAPSTTKRPYCAKTS